MKILKLIAAFVLALVLLAVIGQILPRPTPPTVGQIINLSGGMQINTYQKGEG